MPRAMPRALFKPVQFASVTARNRVVMAPMLTRFADADGEVTERQVSYYAERALGGVGTIIVEASPVRRDAYTDVRQLGSYEDRFIPGLGRLAAVIKANGATALLQLTHGGPKILSSGGLRTQSVSSIGILRNDTPQVLTVSDLQQVRKDFVAAAKRARIVGFDGVELHAGHFYLLGASISPFTNNRVDEYGGSTLARTLLTREIILAIKEEVDSDYPVWVRMNACEKLASGLSLEEGQQVATIMAQAGADAIHVSAYTLPVSKALRGGLNINVGSVPYKHTPPGPFLPFAAAIKRVVTIPVIAVGKLDDPELAESALADGKCDMIALGRQLLCDPYWAKKLDEGIPKEIVHCTYCTTCSRVKTTGEEVRCALNHNLYGEPIYKRQLSRSNGKGQARGSKVPP